MPGVEFDRQVFATVADTATKKEAPKAVGALVLVVILGLAGLVGYKIFTQTSENNALTTANAHVAELQQQLADSQKRLDELEKHRKAVKPEPAPAPAPQPVVAAAPKPKPTYHVVAASVMPAQPKPVAIKTAATQPQMAIPQQLIAENAAMKTELNANHEAWQATTDRLADVVGVVGQQQNEITETRDVVNQLLTQNRRQALSFELQRGNAGTPVGPVSLQLRTVDSKSQRYSVCVYFQDSCIQLKDRVLNEVVVFVVDKNKGPLELVATKVMKDQIVGYLQVPVEPQQAH